jgi:septal ring factor EnvC (AmiA/AmiB activator)
VGNLEHKIKKIEGVIKELNAIKADYRHQFEESEKALARKEISQDHFDRVKNKYDERVLKLNQKIVARREELEALRKELNA